MSLRGSCLCGALQYEVTGELTGMFHCHCSRCRKSYGAPFATFGTTGIDGFRWIAGEDEVATHAVPPGGPRGFCRHCGSPAPGIIPALGIAFFAVGELDGDPGMRPQQHFFTGSKAPWHFISDTLPQHAAFPPGFGGKAGLPDLVRPAAGEGAIAGSCLCGEVAFEFRNPVAMFQCHCTRCRKARGAAHSANIVCMPGDFRWTRGEELAVEFPLPGARFFGVGFCARCGASLPRESVGRGIWIIPASTLDTDPGIRPMAHIFVDSKAPWFEITDGLPRHAEGPPSFVPPR